MAWEISNPDVVSIELPLVYNGFVPGRIWLRFKELKKHLDLAQDLKARVLAIPGITKVEMSPVTGSILIEYDAKVLSTERLIEIGSWRGWILSWTYQLEY